MASTRAPRPGFVARSRQLGLLLQLGVQLVALALAHPAAAEGGSTAPALSARDGRVQTQAGLRLAIEPAPGVPDRVQAVAPALTPQLAALRTCYGRALSPRPDLHGEVGFELTVTRSGIARVRLVADQMRDRGLLSCFTNTLSQVRFARELVGARVRLLLTMTSPLADMHERLAEAAKPPNVSVVGKRAVSEGATQAGEIRYRIQGPARSAASVGRLAGVVAGEIAGLLDCRRGAAPLNKRGSALEFALRIRHGELSAKPRKRSRRGPGPCVARWLAQLPASGLDDGTLKLAIRFSR